MVGSDYEVAKMIKALKCSHDPILESEVLVPALFVHKHILQEMYNLAHFAQSNDANLSFVVHILEMYIQYWRIILIQQHNSHTPNSFYLIRTPRYRSSFH